MNCYSSFKLKKYNCIVFVLLIFFYFNEIKAQQIDKAALKNDITFLASDDLKGRGTGSREELKAANYIATKFKELQLLPQGENGTYIQSHTFKEPANPHASIDSAGKERLLHNVIGFLDNNAANTIVIGAHYDHLGLGHDGNSLDANPKEKIHHGADDNASGTAGVIALAKYYATNRVTENNNYLFICFSGEELGLFGSKLYCEKPTVALNKITAMINMDMIGRLEKTSKKLMIYGVGTAPQFVDLLKAIPTDLNIMTDSSGIGPSDQTSFYLKDIPVLHFFTGQHSDYHKPSDTEDKINYEGEEMVLNYIIEVVNSIDPLEKLKFLTTKSKASDAPAFKVTLGIMPDYMFSGVGLHVDGVTEGKPAFKAGLLKDDVILKLGTVTVKDMQTYMEALAKFKKGDETQVQVLRGNDLKTFNVTF